jgi:endonuclease III
LSKVFQSKFDVDKEKAARIARRLYDQFYGRERFFADYQMPEYILPRNLVPGSKEHAQYLTLVISIDKRTGAEKLWRNSRETYELYPDRFDPSVIASLGNTTLTSFVRRLGARYPKEGGKAWKRISSILIEKYDGDPRRLTPEPSMIDDVKSKLDDLPQLRGPKLSNFYLRAMGETGLLKLSDFDDLPIPVDIQVARFTTYTGTLRLASGSFEGCVHNNPFRGLIEEVWHDAAKEVNTQAWKLDEPIWTIGSRLCSKRLCSKCPVEDLCDKVKDARFRGSVVTWERASG